MQDSFNLILLITVILFGFITSVTAQSLPDKYAVYNKSHCEAVVKVGCTNGTTTDYPMQSQGFVFGQCGVGNAVCFVQIEFNDGNVGPEVIKLDPLTAALSGPCLSPWPNNILFLLSVMTAT